MLTVVPDLPGLTPSLGKDDDEAIYIDQDDADDLIGLFVGIEYQDANGRVTRRRITIKSAAVDRINTYCHERQAMRSFRIDRIISFIDLDGVIYTPEKYFGDVVRTAGESGSRPAQNLKREFKHEIKVLASLSACDGFMHDAEVEEIVQFVEMQAENESIAYSDDDLDALARSVRRTKITWTDAANALDAIASSRQYESRVLNLVKAAPKMAYAYGFAQAMELVFLLLINEILGDP